MRTQSNGFTLIELLVVMAIIGTLASVIITVLNVGRNKGIDANIRSNLDSARPQSELFYDADGNVYAVNSGDGTDVCNSAADGSLTRGIRGIYPSVLAAARANSIFTVTYNTTPAAGVAVCNSTVGLAGGWAVQVPLKFVPGSYFCIDYTGAATTTTGGLTNGTDVTC
jgi:prepilin-type N-terminal cleavage/methylation domain-containing protein